MSPIQLFGAMNSVNQSTHNRTGLLDQAALMQSIIQKQNQKAFPQQILQYLNDSNNPVLLQSQASFAANPMLQAVAATSQMDSGETQNLQNFFNLPLNTIKDSIRSVENPLNTSNTVSSFIVMLYCNAVFMAGLQKERS